MPAFNEMMHPGTLGEFDLQLVEQALLDAILDVGSDRTNAVDRLFHKMDAAGGVSEASLTRRQELEELVAVAVMDQHPNRHRALDRILNQMAQSAPVV